MRRGDIVAVASSGDHGKPRPAVIVQTDAPDFRVTIDPSGENGLLQRSQIMVDKPVTIRRERIGRRIGRLYPGEVVRLDTALAFVMGLAD